MAAEERALKKCFRCRKSEPGPGGVLCPGCVQEITTASPAYDIALANAKKLSKQYTTSQYR
ncbi:hypothetical protein [Amycolatopsis sp. FDAARGOS 1241]|uniref:hypothetical protein n=1 Tax=Amycolatopsis sp. FDAARGOS 1241 TaxID=2778070 RepID=UPI001950AF83|nr:hypothetical protein [Amycolatopsis sp. FDAARGOS 1241]QRP42815.1 hypothetical protein I6J71_25455 [Amycolatopsis sp. FDAARGOS 1241]